MTDEPLWSRYLTLMDWLNENAPYAQTDQRHLDEGTVERAYWHYGYAMALADVLRRPAEPADPKSLS